MPIIKSAKKRVRVAEKAATRNSKTKRNLKTALKAFHRAITGGTASDKKASVTTHREVQSNVDKAVKKNVIHRNKAARQKRHLSKLAKAASETPAKAKAAKAPAKKAAPAAAKKTAAKK